MKINSKQQAGQPIDAITDALKSSLTARWRSAADFINARLARVPEAWLRFFLLLLSALSGIYCLGLITGFL